MNKDIPKPVVKNVTVVIKPGETNEHWSVYLVNSNSFPIKNILVASEGYGKKEPNRENTSIIRQYFEELPGESSLQIELIDPKVFHLFNEYGVTGLIGANCRSAPSPKYSLLIFSAGSSTGIAEEPRIWLTFSFVGTPTVLPRRHFSMSGRP